MRGLLLSTSDSGVRVLLPNVTADGTEESSGYGGASRSSKELPAFRSDDQVTLRRCTNRPSERWLRWSPGPDKAIGRSYLQPRASSPAVVFCTWVGLTSLGRAADAGGVRVVLTVLAWGRAGKASHHARRAVHEPLQVGDFQRPSPVMAASAPLARTTSM